MSIIETCGGYEKAKIYVKNLKDLKLNDAAELFETELLEYRRANGIYEEGDTFVVLPGKAIVDTGNLIRVISGLGGRWVWGSDGYSYQAEYIRHATDEEIKFGCRVDQINTKILEKFGGRENVATILENAEGVRNVSTLGMTVTVERLRVAYES